MEVKMTVHNTNEEKQLMKLIDEMPVSSEKKQDWTGRIRTGGFNEELADEIHAGLAEHPEDNFPDRGRIMIQLNSIVHRWRLQTSLQTAKHKR
jgi:hypothetical protein